MEEKELTIRVDVKVLDALEFYAKSENYDEMVEGAYMHRESRVAKDHGELAREALEALRG